MTAIPVSNEPQPVIRCQPFVITGPTSICSWIRDVHIYLFIFEKSELQTKVTGQWRSYIYWKTVYTTKTRSNTSAHVLLPWMLFSYIQRVHIESEVYLLLLDIIPGTPDHLFSLSYAWSSCVYSKWSYISVMLCSMCSSREHSGMQKDKTGS